MERLTLQKIAWSSATTGNSGNTWAYSNRQPKKTVDFFGDTSTNFSISRLKRGVTQSQDATSDIVTIWLNDVNDEEVELYKAEYGEEIYIDEDDRLYTKAQYQASLQQDTDDSVSEQPFN